MERTIKDAIDGLQVAWDGEDVLVMGMAPIVQHVADVLKAKGHKVVLVFSDDRCYTQRPYDIVTIEPDTNRCVLWCVVVHEAFLAGHEEWRRMRKLIWRRWAAFWRYLDELQHELDDDDVFAVVWVGETLGVQFATKKDDALLWSRL